ncbi:hypothetical protein BsWGS_22798 [Bradybaena similaris]
MSNFFRDGWTVVLHERPTWYSSLTSQQAPTWTSAGTVAQRYAVAYAVNTFKAKAAGSQKPSIFQTPERIRLVSYLEAILEDSSNILKATWGGATPLTTPTSVAASLLPAIIGTTTTTTVTPSFWDEVAQANSQTPSATWASYSTSILSAPVLNLQLQHFRSAQFTFLFAIAKKGDATQRCTNKAVREIQQELGIDNAEIYSEELYWICQKVTANLTTHSEWEALFKKLSSEAEGVKSMKTVLELAAKAGTTKLQIVKKVYNQYPRFDWMSIERIFPGQLAKAAQMNATLAKEPYRVFYAPTPMLGQWEPTGFLDVAHISWLLLQAAGDASISGYRGFDTHHLKGESQWRQIVMTYMANYTARKEGALNTSSI